jgi:HPt (histidine-containing phosphotransfer) domain-containing protein
MHAAIDVDVLQRATGEDPELISEIIEDFIAYAHSGIAAIPTAIVREDAKQLGITLHRLKESASLVGAYGLLDTLTRVEAAADATDWPTAHRLLPHLHESMKHIEKAAAAVVDVWSSIWR